jgi:chromosome segregation ATPase
MDDRLKEHEDRIRNLENRVTDLSAEMRIYIKQTGENITNIRSLMEKLQTRQFSEHEIENIITRYREREKDKGMQPIVMELLRVLGTAVVIIGGLQVIGG